jgi:hypothetical protein
LKTSPSTGSQSSYVLDVDDGDNKRLRGETWLAFLERDVLLPVEPDGRQQGPEGYLTSNDLLRLARWRHSGIGPSKKMAREFLGRGDRGFEAYVQYCRDLFLQPFEGENLPLNWFARW